MTTTKHTPTPWNIHRAYIEEKPFLVELENEEPYIVFYTRIASGDKIIGQINMDTANVGWPCVDSVIECKANAALIVRAVNAHEELVRACAMALETIKHAALSEFNIPQDYLEKALAKARGES